MKNRSLFTVLALVLLAVAAMVMPALAQDEMDMEDASYDGRFTFDVPSGYTLNESLTNDTIRVEGEDGNFTVIGMDSYNQVLGAEEFETDADELAFYLERVGYEVAYDESEDEDGNIIRTPSVGGIAPSAENGILAGSNITLERRGLSGFANLVDLGSDRRVVVISLNESGATPRELNTILDSLNAEADIVDIALSDENFSILVQLVSEFGLVDTLRGGEYTVFAPTNDAFLVAVESLGYSGDDLEGLLANQSELVESILLYHVVEGTLMMPDSATTLNGADLMFGVGEANFVATNIEAYNGVVHVIDSVLLPPPPAAEDAMESDEDDS